MTDFNQKTHDTDVGSHGGQSRQMMELFETGKHISVDIFSDEYLDKINAIQLPNTKIKVLQRLLSQAIDEYKKVDRIMGMEFSDRLKRVVDEYNNRRRDEAFANEVLDDVAEQLAKLLEELKKEKDSFKGMGIDYEEKAFYDILKAVAKKYEFEYPDDKMIELSKRIKVIVDDKAKYTDWSTRDDIKANVNVNIKFTNSTNIKVTSLTNVYTPSSDESLSSLVRSFVR